MNIFITGGTTGIGLELAKTYLREGHRVAVCGRSLSKLPADVKEQFPKLEAFELDVKDREQTLKIIREFVGKGSLDMMVANAGRSHGDKTRIPDFDGSLDVINVNVLGLMYSFEGALEYMLKQKSGHLVGISSVAGFIGLPGAGAYCASKAAVLKLCESYSIDFASDGITVSAICPGFIDTPLTQKNDHPMPFLMSAEESGRRIKRALDKKKALYIFPNRMKVTIYFLEKMPRFCYRFLMKSLAALNFSRG